MSKSKGLWLGAGIVGVGLLTIYSMNQRKKKPNLIIRDSLPFGFNAMTIPPIGIFVNRCNVDNKKLLCHELMHWKQYQDRGLIPFYVGYAIQKIRYGYDRMPMERECRVGENDYARDNYTDAVRSGHAETIYNPDFRR